MSLLKLHAVPLLFLVLCPIILLSHALFSEDMFFYRDFWQLYYPGLQWGTSLMKGGDFPFWNPYNCCGYPTFAGATFGYAYPPLIILILLPFDWGIKLYILIHFLWAGWGMYLFARSLECSPVSATLAGCLFMLSGPLVSGVNNVCYLTSPSWIPWALMFYVKLQQENKGRWLLLTAFSMTGMALAGEIQTCYNTGFILLFFSLTRLSKPCFFKQLWHLFLNLFLIGILSILLAAVQLFPTLELFFNSDRTSVSEGNALLFPFTFRHIVRFFAPFFYGNPTHFWQGLDPACFHSSIYLGMLTLPLIFLGIFAKKSSQSKCFILLTSLFFFLSSFTDELPFYSLFRHFIPLWSSFRYGEKLLLPAMIPFMILAAWGLEYFVSLPKKKQILSTIAITMVLFLFLILVTNVFLPVKNYAKFYEQQHTYDLYFLWMIATIALIYGLFKKSPELFALILCAVICIDTIYQNRQIIPVTDKSYYRIDCHPLVKTFTDDIQYRVAIYQEVGFPGRWSTQLDMGRMHQWWALANMNVFHRIQRDFGIIQAFIMPYSALRWCGVQKPKLFGRFSHKRVIWGFPHTGSGTNQLSYTDISEVRPRSSLVYKTIKAANLEDAVEKMLDADLHTVVMLQPDLPSLDIPEDKSKQHVEMLPSKSPNMTIIKTNTTHPAYLLLTDNYYPGWRAFVDGKQVEIFRGEICFRLIFLPAGEHTVIFRYTPVSFYAGLLVSALTWIGILGIWCYKSYAKKTLQSYRQSTIIKEETI